MREDLAAIDRVKEMISRARRSAEAYIVYATIASGVRHLLTKLEYDAERDTVALEIHAEVFPSFNKCEGCGGEHVSLPILPSDMGYGLDNPPLPFPNAIFLDPAPPPHVLKPFLN